MCCEAKFAQGIGAGVWRAGGACEGSTTWGHILLQTSNCYELTMKQIRQSDNTMEFGAIFWQSHINTHIKQLYLHWTHIEDLGEGPRLQTIHFARPWHVGRALTHSHIMEIVGNHELLWACNLLQHRGDDSFQKLRERLRTCHAVFQWSAKWKDPDHLDLSLVSNNVNSWISEKLLSGVLRSSPIFHDFCIGIQRLLLAPVVYVFIHFSADQDLGLFRCSHGAALWIHGWCVHPPHGEPLGPAPWAAWRMGVAPRCGRTSRCWEHCSAAASARAGGQRCWGSWSSCKVGMG